ncbi:hypothetical protein C8Q76DRAFT_738669 [Earliella scabrosa]|nr:hypothetical protein C8Q76DRAFT_738669 [Earliella scabrosa]
MMLALPEELVIRILKHLKLKYLLRCTQVCSRLRDIVKDSVELQYCIELAADGLVDGIGCSLSTAERLERLLQLRVRWRYLEWTRVTQISTPAHFCAYEMTDGVHATSRSSPSLHSRHLSVTWLPTATNPQPRTIEREDIGLDARDFAIDPSQDLIAFLTSDAQQKRLSVHLRRISDNTPHSHASQKELTATSLNEPHGLVIQIADDLVSLFVAPRLIIWNWRTGIRLVDWVGIDFSLNAIAFCFVTTRAFMLVNTDDGGSVSLYTLRVESAEQGTYLPPRPIQPTLVAQLAFPRVKSPHHLIEALSRSSPLVPYPTPGRPFETACDSRMHMLELNYSTGTLLHMFFHNRFLTSLLPPDTGDPEKGSSEVIRLDWHEWGPKNTRVVEFLLHSRAVRCIHGSRVILPPHLLDDEPSTFTLRMMDFNVHPKRHNDPTSTARKPEGRFYALFPGPRQISGEGLFEHDIETSLPYTMTMREDVPSPMAQDYYGFMIDREVLFGLGSRWEGPGYLDSDVYIF